MQAMNSMQDLMMMSLGDLYTAEQTQLNALPMIIKAAKTPALRDALMQHANQTQTHVERLEKIFQKMGQQAKTTPNPVLDAMLRHGQDVMQIGGDPAVKEAALICEAQKFEHMEMAGYGTAAALAKQMGDQETAQLLAQTLQEEKQSDELLTQIAESTSNPKAVQSGS
jgi:ferritin-like metal-binding protein YciE